MRAAIPFDHGAALCARARPGPACRRARSASRTCNLFSLLAKMRQFPLVSHLCDVCHNTVVVCLPLRLLCLLLDPRSRASLCMPALLAPPAECVPAGGDDFLYWRPSAWTASVRDGLRGTRSCPGSLAQGRRGASGPSAHLCVISLMPSHRWHAGLLL